MLERRHCGILSAPRGGPRPHLSSCSVPRGPAGPAPILQNRAPWRMDLDGPRRAEEQGPGLAPPGLERRRAARGLECGDPATERGAHAGPSALVSPDPRTGWSWRAPGPGPRACPSRACRPGRNLAPGTWLGGAGTWGARGSPWVPQPWPLWLRGAGSGRLGRAAEERPRVLCPGRVPKGSGAANSGGTGCTRGGEEEPVLQGPNWGRKCGIPAPRNYCLLSHPLPSAGIWDPCPSGSHSPHGEFGPQGDCSSPGGAGLR